MNTIKKNFIYQSTYQMLIIVLPFITVPYVSNILGSENVGIYSYTNTIANYFVVFAMLGMEQYGNRCIAQVRDDENKRNEIFSELLTIQVIVSSLVFSVYLVLTLVYIQNYKFIFLIQSLYVFSTVFDINWFFWGIENFKFTVMRNLIIKGGSILLLFLLVKEKEDLWKYCLIMSGGTLCSHLFNFFYVFKHVQVKKIHFEQLLKHFKPLLILFVAIIAAHVYRMMDKVMLGNYGKMKDLGCYEYADKFIRVPLSLITSFGTVMLSKMSSLVIQNKKKTMIDLLDKSAVYVIYLSIALAFGIAGIAPEFIIVFLGDEYKEAVILLILLSISIPLISWNNFIRTQILIPIQKDNIYTNAVCVGALVNVLFNIWLIPKVSARGAAIATIIAYFSVSIVQTVPLLKEFSVTKYLKSSIFPMLCGGIMFVIIRIVGELLGKSWMSIIVEIVVGIIVFSIPSFFYINEEIS